MVEMSKGSDPRVGKTGKYILNDVVAVEVVANVRLRLLLKGLDVILNPVRKGKVDQK